MLGFQLPSTTVFNTTLPVNITRNVTNGAAVTIPSELMSFYFSGMRGKEWGAITLDDASANTTARSLISVNMTRPDNLSWQNETLPSFVSPRANAEVLWFPVSEHGALAALGGVLHPEVIYPLGLSDIQIAQDVRFTPNLGIGSNG